MWLGGSREDLRCGWEGVGKDLRCGWEGVGKDLRRGWGSERQDERRGSNVPKVGTDGKTPLPLPPSSPPTPNPSPDSRKKPTKQAKHKATMLQLRRVNNRSYIHPPGFFNPPPTPTPPHPTPPHSTPPPTLSLATIQRSSSPHQRAKKQLQVTAQKPRWETGERIRDTYNIRSSPSANGCGQQGKT